MVFTIEPGLYFPKPIRRVPACGVRIEDDVLVTESGGEILSRGFPKDPDSIAALFN
jgi:Xaa-Pro aminopeptidase